MQKKFLSLFLAVGLALTSCGNAKDGLLTTAAALETGASGPETGPKIGSTPIKATLVAEKTKEYCDCLDKRLLSYLASHSTLKASEVGDAKLSIGAPCYEQFQQFEKSFSKNDLEKFDETKEGRKLISSMLTCGYDMEAKLTKRAK